MTAFHNFVNPIAALNYNYMLRLYVCVTNYWGLIELVRIQFRKSSAGNLLFLDDIYYKLLSIEYNMEKIEKV